MIEGFSIIVCTHNADKPILKRLLIALGNLQDVSGYTYEIIFVDNNSSSSLNTSSFFVKWLLSENQKKIKVVQESKPGLTWARIKGIKEAKYQWLIFFDDDNEPADNYLVNTHRLVNLYPMVGAWGPGKIKVEFINVVKSDWVRSKCDVFQQKELNSIFFDNNPQWQNDYPFGTGLVIKKEIALKYVENVVSNKYTLTDRNGKSLSSGGDVQLVLTGVKEGYYAGSSPELSLNHLINSDKANFSYLIRLIYGTASSNLPAHFQVNGSKTWHHDTKYSNSQILRKLYYFFKTVALKQGGQEFCFKLSHFLGELQGLHIVTNKRKPILQTLLEKALL